MALLDMQNELRGCIPKVPLAYCKTLVNRAWRTVRERNLWSFQLFEGQWITPPILSGTGTATVVQGSNLVQLDANAIAFVNAQLALQLYSDITQRQFRIQLSGVYNIWDYDSVGGVLTLDRPFAEFSGSGDGYQIYQVYYIPQRSAGANPEFLQDFKAWISVRNIQNFIDLFTDRYNRTMLDAIDPQRTTFQFPTDVVPYQKDQNPDSATLGYFMFELWGAPLSNYVYQLFGIRRGLDLAKPTDTLPMEVGEDCILALSRVYGYEWAESNRDLNIRAAGPDYKFLMGQAQKEHDGLLRLYRQQDREKVDNWFEIRRSAFQGKVLPYYNSIGNTAFPGAFP